MLLPGLLGCWLPREAEMEKHRDARMLKGFQAPQDAGLHHVISICNARSGWIMDISKVEPRRCAAKADVMGCRKEKPKEGCGVEPEQLDFWCSLLRWGKLCGEQACLGVASGGGRWKGKAEVL